MHPPTLCLWVHWHPRHPLSRRLWTYVSFRDLFKSVDNCIIMVSANYSFICRKVCKPILMVTRVDVPFETTPSLTGQHDVILLIAIVIIAVCCIAFICLLCVIEVCWLLVTRLVCACVIASVCDGNHSRSQSTHCVWRIQQGAHETWCWPWTSSLWHVCTHIWQLVSRLLLCLCSLVSHLLLCLCSDSLYLWYLTTFSALTVLVDDRKETRRVKNPLQHFPEVLPWSLVRPHLESSVRTECCSSTSHWS